MGRAHSLLLRSHAYGAVAVLEAGKGIGLLSSDHASGETCAQTILRDDGKNTNRRTDPKLEDIARTAVRLLKSGRGWDLAASDHSSDTCVETIVRLA